MDSKKNYFQKPELVNTLEFFSFCFFWLKWFYPKAHEFEVAYLLAYFVPQKILRNNGRIPWPVHKTSRVLYHKNIQVGNRSAPGLNSGCYVQGRGGIIIGSNFRMGPNVGLISANHDPENYDQWIDVGKPIVIGDNVWVAMNSVVMPGISIGSNVIIGANSVVTKDIPKNSVTADVPCKVIHCKSSYKGKTFTT